MGDSMTNYETTYGIAKLAHLLAVLRPAPAGWSEAATELPRLRGELQDLVARAERDAELRARLESDLESALAESGTRPTPRILAEARRRLGS
jgi:hypothetical protein